VPQKIPLRNHPTGTILTGIVAHFLPGIDTEEVSQAGKSLKAFGFDAAAIVPTMTRLGDVAAGLNIPIGELSELYGKARTQGTLFSEDINQLTGRGIPIIS